MAGPLAEIYSASDSFKRKLVDALRNPQAKLEQIVGDANDRARTANEMLYAATDEGPGRGPETDRLAKAMAESYNPMGMTMLKKPLGYNPAKIANQYPDTAPAVLAVDKKTGKEFLQKENSAEALAVEKVRKAAQKDIDQGNYTPYFDVNKRVYADASKYPLQGATLTDALPKKQATIDKWTEEFDRPEIKQNLKAAYLRGSKDPMTKDWYATGQLEKEFVKEYGPKAGRAE